MADKKLNEVPVVNDIVTILGKRSNGEIVQIDKSNLASIVGELIGINDTWLRGLGTNQKSDFNAITKTGFYTIGDISKLSNRPFDGVGTLMVLSGTGFGYRLQVLFATENMAFRMKYSDEGIWIPWMKLYN